ncbi:MAG: hypothetical protein VW270_09265 [Candidatus Poseidoniales archaeon]|jgi:hypothetical protein
MSDRTVKSAHERIDELEKQIVGMRTEMDIQFKDLFNRVKRLEMVMIGINGAVLALLIKIIMDMQ